MKENDDKDLLITSKGEIREVSPKGAKWTLEECQELVGGYIEPIDLGGSYMLVDEEGKLKPEKKRKKNLNAMWVLFEKHIQAEIVGDVLLVSKKRFE